MDKLERLETIENISFSDMGDFIVDYTEYWSSKLGLDEITLLKKLFNYVDITISKRIVDDQLFFLNYSQINNNWLEDSLDG